MYSTLETRHMDAYNKHAHGQGHGTLMANWWEEDELRITNGHTRTTLMKHMEKTHDGLFPDVKQKFVEVNQIARDNTTDRILGNRPAPRYIAEN